MFHHKPQLLVLLLLLSMVRRTASLSSSSASSSSWSLLKSSPYTLPSWAASRLTNLPTHGRLRLANLPTPLYQIAVPPPNNNNNNNNNNENKTTLLQRILSHTYQNDGSNTDANADANDNANSISLFIKRDDMSGGVELGGNKVRKLEFLLADALAQGCDSVVTIGGEQSNHCRATAAAARMLGLQPHIILRTKRKTTTATTGGITHNSHKFGYTGNILFDRMVGSTIYTCTPGEYGRIGSDKMVQRVCRHLETKHGMKPYAIPVGGSNGLGTWGYIHAVDELMKQQESCNDDDDDDDDDDTTDSPLKFDHVVFACGSGGTAAGIALGFGLWAKENSKQQQIKVHAIGVCDDPDYFYDHVAGIAEQMGFRDDHSTAQEFVRNNMIVHQGKGLGYAASTKEELGFVTQFSLETGIVLDPVYSGKALYHFFQNVVLKDPETYKGKNILFWHTGGNLGLFDKGDDLDLDSVSKVRRLDVYGKNEEGTISI